MGAVRTVSVALMMRVSDYVAKAKVATQATKEMVGAYDKLAKESPEKARRITSGMMLVGGALLAVSGTVIKFAADFDKQMSHVDAVANASAKEMGALREAALQAGKATQYSATEAAQAEEELVKAGISVKDVLGGGLAGALNLAAAGQMELADAATIAAQAMNIFHLQGSAVPHVADVLASAANKSAADMKDLGDAMRMGGLVSSQMGLSLEDTIGTLAAFADRALIGSDAGTSLKSMLAQLAAPTQKSASLMEQLGINIYDAQGNFIGITKLAGVLQQQLGGLTAAQRNQAITQIFGTDAMRSANILYDLGAQGLQGYITAVDDTGAAQETARKKTDNLAGDIERLTGSVQTLAIESGSGANGGLRMLVKVADALVTTISKLPAPVQSSIVVLTAISGASLLAAGGFLKARQTVQDLLDALENMGPAGTRAAGALRTMGSVAGKLGLVGAAVGGIWYGLDRLAEWADKKHAPVTADIDKLTVSLKEFAATGKAAGELAAKYGERLQAITKDVPGIITGQKDLAESIEMVRQGLLDQSVLGNVSDYVDPQAVQRVKDLDTALSGLVANGGANQAALVLQRLRDSGALTGDQFNALLAMLPQYRDATNAASTANTGLAKGFADTATAAGVLNSSLAEQISKGLTLADVWNQLHGAVLNSDQAMLSANKAVEDATKTIKDNKKAIEGNSTAALENRVKIEEVAQAAAKAAQAKFEETDSIDEANAVYKTYQDQLTGAFKKAGILTGGIQTLINKIFSMPPTYAVSISTPGLSTANDRVRALGEKLAALPASKTITITTYDKMITLHPHADTNRWGGVYEKAAAGTLREAAYYSPANPGRYMIAEPETGGEMFVPKHGNKSRSLGHLSKAAGWYGAMVVPGGNFGVRAGGNRTIVEHRHTLIIDSTGLLSGQRRQINLNGGSTQTFYGRG